MPPVDKEVRRDYNKQYRQKNSAHLKEQDRQFYLKLTPKEKRKRWDRQKELRKNRGYKGKFAQALELGYRSMFEVSIAKAAEEAGLEMEYEPFFIPYQIKGSYKPDFQLPNKIIVEAKGYLDAGTCRKMLAVKASNPHLDIRFVFQDANGKRNKRSKLKNWQWAEKHGFQWAEGAIPLEWFKEPKVDG